MSISIEVARATQPYLRLLSREPGRPRAPEPLAPLLRWKAGSGATGRRALGRSACTIGADPSNTLALADPCLSRFHCELQVRSEGRVWVRDLGSRNGTYVDGLRIAEAELLAGARLRLGETSLWLEPEARPGPPSLPGMVTSDPAFRPALDLLKRAAPSRLPVLLFGESGCGKEVAARALHDLSPRSRGPFVPLNCGAIASELAEAELFGHERGAFTGAVGSAPGAFGAADGGTLFLDEIGDLPLALQVKLLRALESSEIKPLGAARPRSIDVRVVAATHRDLRAKVADGSFREDLYYRLSGVAVRLPSLRERPLDILPLAEHFLASEDPAGHRSFSHEAREALLAHPWPGNARELRNAVGLAALLSDSALISRAALRLDLAPARAGPAAAEGGAATCAPEPPLPANGAPQAAAPPEAPEPPQPHPPPREPMGAPPVEPLPVPASSPLPQSEPRRRVDVPYVLDLEVGPPTMVREGGYSMAPAHAFGPDWICLRGMTLEQLEVTALRAAYVRHRGVRKKISWELGIPKTSLHRKLTQLGLRSPEDPEAEVDDDERERISSLRTEAGE